MKLSNHAAVDGAGWHTHASGFKKTVALLGEAVEQVVLRAGSGGRALKALALDAQHVHHVQLGQRLVQVARHMVGAQDVGGARAAAIRRVR